MTRDEAFAEAERGRVADPGASWIASEHDGDWVVVRVVVPPIPPASDQSYARRRASLSSLTWGWGPLR
jgi:hypothetical protein